MSAPTPEEIKQVEELVHRLLGVIGQHPHYSPAVVLNAVISTYVTCADWSDMLDQVPQALMQLSAKAAELGQARKEERPVGVPLH